MRNESSLEHLLGHIWRMGVKHAATMSSANDDGWIVPCVYISKHP